MSSIVCLMGATATGKSQLALALTELFPFDLISVDSVMVYRHMNIGTAKPDINTLARIPHHLIDIRNPDERYSAGEFLRDTQHKITQSLKLGRIPLLVGGTMLYFHLLRSGLANIPNEMQHPALKTKIENTPLDALYHTLKIHDPTLASKIHPNDTQRIQRAVFVYQSTGIPLSYFQKETTQNVFSYPTSWIILNPKNRNDLRTIIQQRFQLMLKDGFVEEVKELYQNFPITEDLPAAKAVGYRQIREYLSGKSNYETMQTHAIHATCQLAKRQFTWLRQWPDAFVFNNDDSLLVQNIQQKISAFLEKNH